MGRKAKRGREICGTEKSVPDGKGPPAEGSDHVEDDNATAAVNGLPMANLMRLMRHVIPTDVKISALAKQLAHDCAVEFVGFVGGEASECAREQHRRTIAPEDFTRSFRRLGFDDYVEPMGTYIRRCRENQQNAAGGASSFGPPPRPPPASSSSFTDEEVQFLMSVVPQPHEEYGGTAGSSEEAPLEPPEYTAMITAGTCETFDLWHV